MICNLDAHQLIISIYDLSVDGSILNETSVQTFYETSLLNMNNKNVFWFIPNIIGYIRGLLYITAFVFHGLGKWQLCIILYFLGFILDELDGQAAKRFNQQSQFGAALDMILDRCATAGLCLILAQLYPQYNIAFILLIALDISSHYYLIYASSISQESSHKNVSNWSNNWLLNSYYNQKIFFDTLIAGNELFYMLVYILNYTVGFQLVSIGLNLGIFQILILICLPLFLLKQLINLLQLQISASKVAAIDLNACGEIQETGVRRQKVN